jgi:uncharacterized protein YjbI with pentapeptide repeats
LAANWLNDSRVALPFLDKITPVNTLDLHGEDLIDDTNLARIDKNETSNGLRWEPTLRLMTRDLSGANLSNTDLRHADLSGANLSRAELYGAWAKNAHFDNALLLHARLTSAQLQGASLMGAKLQVSMLSGAVLQGAMLKNADLQGAKLDNAQLQGADLTQADLQGADLNSAKLQGATLDRAELQGAELEYAQLQGALFRDVCVWRADARQATWGDTLVADPQTGPKAKEHSSCDWAPDRLAAFEHLIFELMDEIEIEQSAGQIASLEQDLDPTKDREGEKEIAKVWTARGRERETLSPEAYAKSLAVQWRVTGCAEDGAPYVLRALIARLSSYGSPFPAQSNAAKALAAAFLDEAHCAGAHGLSEADRATIKEIAAPAAPQAPKP